MSEIKTIVPVPAWVDAMQAQSSMTDVRAAYTAVPLIYRALNLRCDSLLRVPVHIYKKLQDGAEQEVEWELLYPDTSLDDLLWQTQAALLLCGASYVVKLKNPYGIGKGLQWLNPFTVDVRYENGQVYFEQRNAGQGKRWTADEMIYTRLFNPSDDIGAGISPCDVAMQAARLSLNIAAFAGHFFEHGAMPITTVSVVGAMQKAEQERIQSFFRRATQGVRNAFRVLAVGNDVKIQTTQNPLSELATPELNDAARKDIARAFGLPVTMLDADENYATASQHATTYLMDTVLPAADKIAAALNKQLLEPQGYCIEFAYDEMQEFQADEAERAGSLQTLISAIQSAQSPEILRAAMEILGYDIPEEIEKVIFAPHENQEAQQEQQQAADMQNNAAMIDPNAEQKAIERAQFRRYVKKGKDPQAFKFAYLSPCEQADLKMEIEGAAATDTPQDPFFQSMNNSAKSVQAVTRQFCARLRKLIKDFWAESELDPNISLDTELRALIEYHVSAAYFEGLKEGGLTEQDFDADMSQRADDLVFEQFAHVDGFVQAIDDAYTDKGARDGVLSRAELWCNSVAAAGLAGLNDAKAAEIVTWKLGKTEEHCETCAWLDGQRHRRKWFTDKGYIPRQPGSQTLECGGWRCDCELVPVVKNGG